MNEPEETIEAKHVIFSMSMIGSLLVAAIAIVMALMAGNDGNYVGGGVCLIAAAISLGVVKVCNLLLIRY